MAEDQQTSDISNKKIVYSIIGLIITIIMWTFSGIKDNQNLQNQIKQIQKQRDSLQNNINNLQTDYKSLQSADSLKYIRLQQINDSLVNIESDLQKSLDNLNNLQSSVDSINNKIKNDTFIKRTGDDLINSLRKKLN